MRKLPSWLLLTVLGGCFKVGPDYQQTPVATPENWRFADQEARDVTNLKWWEQLGDPVLNRLVGQALRNNRDLRIAAANVEQFMGLYGATRSELFPKIFGSGEFQHRLRSSNENSLAGAGALDFDNQVQNYTRLGVRTLWELDIWGVLRRANEAARAELLAQEAVQHAVILTLVSEVAQTYLDLRALDENLEITKSVVASLQEELRIARRRFEEGYTSELEVDQVESEYQRRSALIPAAEKDIARAELALKVLLGENPGPIPRGLAFDEIAMPPVPAGLPSELLQRRPDIQQAEQQLIAANARIGMARGQYFPRMFISADVGQASTQIAELFAPGALFWSVGSRLMAPIFTAGQIAGDVQAAEGAHRAALANYQQSVLMAFREFEEALVSRRKTRVQQEQEARRVAAVQRYVNLAQIRYDEGYTDFITVLDSLRQLYEAQIELLQARTAHFTAAIDLYRAMGGGWIVTAEEAAHLPKPAEVSVSPF